MCRYSLICAIHQITRILCVVVCCSVLQCVAVCCSVLQCVAVCCSVLQLVAICAIHPHQITHILCVAVCCSVLQCVAACCNMRYTSTSVLASLVYITHTLCLILKKTHTSHSTLKLQICTTHMLLEHSAQLYRSGGNERHDHLAIVLANYLLRGSANTICINKHIYLFIDINMYIHK